MKKIFSLIIILIVFSSCQEDIRSNNPGFQVFKDDVLWRGLDVKAYKSTSSGAFRIVAIGEDGKVEMNTNSSNIGTYVLGVSNTRTASYTYTLNGANDFYTTGIDFGDGQIKITDNSSGVITGSFLFNARNLDNDSMVNFQYGAFYKIPLIIEP